MKRTTFLKALAALPFVPKALEGRDAGRDPVADWVGRPRAPERLEIDLTGYHRMLARHVKAINDSARATRNP